jgi:hypothetical protein
MHGLVEVGAHRDLMVCGSAAALAPAGLCAAAGGGSGGSGRVARRARRSLRRAIAHVRVSHVT